MNPSDLQLQLGVDERQTIDAYAHRRGMSTSEFVRYAVKLYIDTTTENPDDDTPEEL